MYMHVKYFGGLKGGVPLYYIKKHYGCQFIDSAHSNYDSLQFIYGHIRMCMIIILSFISIHLNVLDDCVCTYTCIIIIC